MDYFPSPEPAMDTEVGDDNPVMNIDTLILAGVDPVAAKKFVLALSDEKPGVT